LESLGVAIGGATERRAGTLESWEAGRLGGWEAGLGEASPPMEQQMRPKRKPDETHAITTLRKYLVSTGHRVEQFEEVTDRPDAAFSVDGIRVACECRHFTPASILELHGKQFVEGKLYQLFIPIEPHSWVREAILAKAPSINTYRATVRADEVWLLIHPPTESGLNFFIPKVDQRYFEMFAIGAWQTAHRFDRIYVTGQDTKDVACIFDRSKEETEGNNYRAANIIKIPVRFCFIHPTRLVESPDGQVVPKMKSLHHPDEKWELQPLDQRFCVDYSQVHGFSYANIGRGAEPPVLYAELIG